MGARMDDLYSRDMEIKRLRQMLTTTRDYLSEIDVHPEPGDIIAMIDATLANGQGTSGSEK